MPASPLSTTEIRRTHRHYAQLTRPEVLLTIECIQLARVTMHDTLYSARKRAPDGAVVGMMTRSIDEADALLGRLEAGYARSGNQTDDEGDAGVE